MRCSNSLVFPAPLCPTRTTLRMSSGALAWGTGVLAEALALMSTRCRLTSAGTTRPAESVLLAHHAEPIRARILHQGLHPTGPVVPQARHQPRRRDDRGHRRRLRRRAGPVPTP